MTTDPDDALAFRSLDEWYLQVNRIYLDRNFYRDPFSIFAHLVEVVGGLSLLASDKQKPEVTPQRFVPKALAWWMALCGKVGVRSVEQMVWWKFPAACPYCRKAVHDNDVCQDMKARDGGPQWEQLDELGRANSDRRPRTLAQWQEMFATVYPVASTEDYPVTFARFTEELGELAEALRVFPLAPGYFLSEAADVFAWLMHLQNLLHSKARRPRIERGKDLVSAFVSSYPDRCSDCGNPICTCPPILLSTLGRIAHEVPQHRASFSSGGALLPIDEAMTLFRASTRSIAIGGRVVEIDARVLGQIRDGVSQMISLLIADRSATGANSALLVELLAEVKSAAESQRLTEESMRDLAAAIAGLEPGARETMLGVLAGVTSSLWASALIELVSQLVPQ